MLARILLVTMLASAVLGQRCADGGCCDLKTGALRAKGTPCQTNPCYLMNACTGDNPYCPTGGVMRANGTVCPDGVCYNGKCKQATKCVADCCDKDARALIDGAPCRGGSCINGICRALPACMGECCNANKKPLADGTPCAEGNCLFGMCTNLDKRCTEGKCCDQYKKLLRPKGFPCTSNPCAAKMQCDGMSENCPAPTHYKPDGTPCPKGVCLAGVCSNNPNATVKVDSTGKLVPVTPSQNKDGKTSNGDSIEIHHHFVAPPSCTSGACCDVTEKRVLDDGRPCANKTCFVGVCDGRSSECAYVHAASGTLCPDGKCFEGQCIKNCIGQCCRIDGVTPRTDGSVCHDGYCFAGTCVKSCKGDCCDTIHGVPQAKADGAACNIGEGYCVKGECRPFTVPVFQPRANNHPKVVPDDSDHKLFAKSFKESFIKNFFRAASKVENDQIDEEERKLIQRQLNRTKSEEIASRQAQEAALLNTTMSLLSSASTSSKSVWSTLTSGTNLIFFIAGCVVAFLAFVIVIVALARSGKKEDKKPEKEAESDFEQDYAPPTYEKNENDEDAKYKF